MTDADLPRSLDVDPSQLDPASPRAPRQSAGAERLDGIWCSPTSTRKPLRPKASTARRNCSSGSIRGGVRIR
ncbi:hypothetical protein ACFRCW_30515 [Streptomyces sp. NPDC056653]|uniref:hypothetical protein n=1 Tax=unclassified Streptomyces TaxID=2593676 RepID=UPI0033AF553F